MKMHLVEIRQIQSNVEVLVAVLGLGAESLFGLLEKTVDGQARRLLHLSLSIGMALSAR